MAHVEDKIRILINNNNKKNFIRRVKKHHLKITCCSPCQRQGYVKLLPYVSFDRHMVTVRNNSLGGFNS